MTWKRDRLHSGRQRTRGLKVTDELEDAFRFLAEWPAAGHVRKDLTDSKEPHFLPSGSYLIAYLPTRQPIVILGVFHGSHDMESLLPRRLDGL